MRRWIWRIVLVSFPLFLQAGLYAGLDTELSAPVLMQGPGAVASVEEISSIYVNPAALTRVMSTEFLINFDSMYHFNYLALAHYYNNFGNLAVGFFRDPDARRDMSTLAYGGKIYRKVGRNLRQEISFGWNASIVTLKDLSVFSSTLGGLYALRKDWGVFRGFYIGLSTSGLLESGADPRTMTGIGFSYMLPHWRAWNISYGNLFDARHGHRYWSVMTEIQIYKAVYVAFGARNDRFAVGLNFKNINDFVYTGALFTPKSGQAEFTVTYRRMIIDARQKLPSRKTATKTGASKQRLRTILPVSSGSEVTEELLTQQRDLLREGLDLYGVKQVAKAVEKWKQVMALNATTEYGRQAESYLTTVQEEIDGMLGK